MYHRAFMVVASAAIALRLGEAPAIAQSDSANPSDTPATTMVSSLPVAWTFANDIVGQPPSGWTEVTFRSPGDPNAAEGPAWTVIAIDEGRAVRGQANGYVRTHLAAPTPALNNVRLAARFRVPAPEGLGGMAVLADFGEEKTFWSFGVTWVAGEPSLVLGKITGDTPERLASQPLKFDASAWHTFELVVVAGRACVTIDGEASLRAHVPRASQPGGIRLLANGSAVEFRDLRLTQITPQVLLDITGMHCEMCEANIEEVLLKVQGVKRVTSSHKTGKVEVEVDPKSPPANETLIKAIEGLKYSAKVHEGTEK